MIADSTPVQPAQISGEATARVAVHVAELRKHYGDVAAVDDVELTVRAGEFFTLSWGHQGQARPACCD
jgi:hypothetical protein